MNKKLILLTNFFPYYKGEEYLESEIPILSKKFDEIVIIPMMIPSEAQQTREIPKNVQILLPQVSHSKFSRISMVLNGLWKNNFKEEKKLSILQRIYSLYFEGRSSRIYNNIENKLLNLLNKNDEIYIYSYWLYVTARVSIDIKNKLWLEGYNNIYTFSRAHRYDLYENEAPLKFLPEREFLLENFDGIYSVSTDGLEHIKSVYPQYADKLHVARLGTVDKGVMKEKENSDFHIVTCAVLRPVKQIDLLIEALSILKDRGMSFKWTHLGDGPELENLKKLAQEKLSNSEYEFKGFVSNKDVFEFYLNESPSIFINISKSEGVPVSIMEAQSVGLPVIATDVGGTREIVVNQKNGILLPKQFNNEELIYAIESMMNLTSTEFNKLSNESRNNWEKISDAKLLYENFANNVIIRGENND